MTQPVTIADLRKALEEYNIAASKFYMDIGPNPKETRERVESILSALEAQEQQRKFSDLESAPGYPWLPCPICSGVEGCDHTAPERKEAAAKQTDLTDEEIDELWIAVLQTAKHSGPNDALRAFGRSIIARVALAPKMTEQEALELAKRHGFTEFKGGMWLRGDQFLALMREIGRLG
jgi:hypothetical protein